jgi:hypothetical protein
MQHVLVVVGGIIPPQVGGACGILVAAIYKNAAAAAATSFDIGTLVMRLWFHTGVWLYTCRIMRSCMTWALWPSAPAGCQLHLLLLLLLLSWLSLNVQDHEELYEMGVAAIYGPGTRIPAAALDMIQLLVGPEALAGDTPETTAASGASAA